ncbi:hypothetical protein RMATCC62417_13577 [Rhizopus microsporus]|nr:hypothetical protein RMATCC62417_13577 [Rhizopus microsporus]
MSESAFKYFQKLEKLIQLSFEKAAKFVHDSVSPIKRIHQVETVINGLAEERAHYGAVNEAVPLKRRRLYPGSAGTCHAVKSFPSGHTSFPSPPVSRFAIRVSRFDSSRRAALRHPTQFSRRHFGRNPASALLTLSNCRNYPYVSFSADVFPSSVPFSVTTPSDSRPLVRSASCPVISETVKAQVKGSHSAPSSPLLSFSVDSIPSFDSLPVSSSPRPTLVRSHSCPKLSAFEYERDGPTFIPLSLPSSPLPATPRSLKRSREDVDDGTSMEHSFIRPTKKLKTNKGCVFIYAKKYAFPAH